MGKFGFTLQIPAGCLIGGIRYREYSYDDQNALLSALLYRYIAFDYKVFYEKHKDGRAHCHGTIKDEGTDFVRGELLLTQKRINKELNYRADCKKLFRIDFLPTWMDIDNWGKYCLKDQTEPERTAPRDHTAIADRSRKFLLGVRLKE